MESTGQPGSAGSSTPEPAGTPPSTSPGSAPPTWQSEPTRPSSTTVTGAPAGSPYAPAAAVAPSAGPAGYYYADVPNRLIAYIIDAIILGIIQFVVGLVLSPITGPTTTVNENATDFNNLVQINYAATLIQTIVGVAISALYFVYSWTRMRATPGQKILGMQVGNETDGATLTTNQALTRWVLLGGPLALASALSIVLGVLISLLALIYFIALLVTTAQSPTKQGLHDRYAHTVVVKSARAVT